MNKIQIYFLLFSILFLSLNAQAENKNAAINKASHLYTIKTSTVKYLSGNDTVSAYLAEPEGKGPFPALIVIHEWWGLVPWIKDNAEHFARNGYVALAIDLYRGKSTTDPKEAGKLSSSVTNERGVRDLIAAFDYLKKMSVVNGKKIGSIGWCMGGTYSLEAALNISDLAACVVAYGSPPTDEKEIAMIKCPLLGIFGDKDQVHPVKRVREFKKIASKEEKNITVVIYSGVAHAFMNPSNKEGYNKVTSEKAWEKIDAFFKKEL